MKLENRFKAFLSKMYSTPFKNKNTLKVFHVKLNEKNENTTSVQHDFCYFICLILKKEALNPIIFKKFYFFKPNYLEAQTKMNW